MPDQGQLFIGEITSSYEQVRDVLEKLGVSVDVGDQTLEDALCDDLFHLEKYVVDDGKTRRVKVEFHWSSETGPDESLVGIELTSRYSPAILDEGMPHGREEPFVVDVERIQTILAQVREWWPDARLILWTVFY